MKLLRFVQLVMRIL